MPTISKAAGQVASRLGAGAQKQRCECTDAGCAADVHQHRAVGESAAEPARHRFADHDARHTAQRTAESDENQRAGAGEHQARAGNGTGPFMLDRRSRSATPWARI